MRTIKLLLGDITKIKVDAIVNAAHEGLSGGGGVDGAIHFAAGQKLLGECLNIGGCKTGQAVVTQGYKLPCKYVIHAVGPVYRQAHPDESATLLANCHRRSLELANEKYCKTVAFPAISCGAYAYPVKQAADIAIGTAAEFLRKKSSLETVYFVLYDKETYKVFVDELQKVK